MKRYSLLTPLFALMFVMGGDCFCDAAEALPARTALDDYVDRKDDSFEWEVVKTSKAEGVQTFVLDMTSQIWRTKAEVNRTRWQHWITVAVPEKIKSKTGFMWIGGGGNGGNPPAGPSDMIQKIAMATGTVVAEVHMIPNQTLIFHNDGRKRVEDDLIAYTWVKFLETGDVTWPARNPMVKSVVRAMDAVTELLASEAGEKRTVNKYVVGGGSKRGWTTWLVGAVDKRVAGIAPVVIDILNLKKSMTHHFSAYGFFAPSVGDYVAHKIIQMADHPRMPQLHALVDPYHYRHRLTMPKFVINASGDQFFPPDLSRYYFDDLVGEKHLRYVPNANHSLNGTDALESLIAFYSLVLAEKDGPKFSWDRPDDHTFRVQTVDQPENVLLWQATNPTARDFRLETLGPKYTSQVLEDQGDGVYVAKVSKPKEGWTAFFVELTYNVGAPTPLKATTNVGIVPDVLPFAKKNPALPTSLTIRCAAPGKETVEQIIKALASPELKSLAKDPRVSTDGKAAEKGIAVSLNWVPLGDFEKGARAIAGQLTKLGCDDIVFQIESGRPVGKINARDGAEMILLPAGQVLLGSTQDEIDLFVKELGYPKDWGDHLLDELPRQHRAVKAFYAYKYEVTNAQYEKFLAATGHESPAYWNGKTAPQGKGNHPVVQVSWEDAEAYCKWAGTRLLTETEWAYAARGAAPAEGKNAPVFPWGNNWDISLANCASHHAGVELLAADTWNVWYKGDQKANYPLTTPVGSFKKSISPFGIHDMAGNAWEWCADQYHLYSEKAPKDDDGARVVRGGSWANVTMHLRSADRNSRPKTTRNLYIGFRCAKTP